MVMVVDADTRTQQQALLTRLLELTEEQRQALDAGDIAAVDLISSLRTHVLQASAAFVPPQCAWDPSLKPQATELQQASDRLQQELLAVMTQVKRDMQELNKREHVLDYVPGIAPQRRMAWNG